nr:site-specific DNA-methyltransferase [uncultured Leptotrichia sp.]
MLNQKIENLLKSNKKYISEKNEILKAKVYEDAVNINKELIELLLSDGKVRETYFTKINGVLVFDKQGFLNFLESKDFLPDSYTAFKNKIGLTDRNGNYLSDNDDVVLSFPYKDCVLVGGQDKDDQKREEKMYNEILASEEISTLFSPKVLTNIKRFGKISSQSVSQSVSQHNVIFSENDNLIIKGNNLIALASLLKRYEGKVKCIYIDPPYNTGNDSFGYNDRFNHSTWLVFMKNRMELAKRLLSDDGIIFVQIDNSPSSINESPEFGYILVLMDEIFGRKNYVTTFTWKKKGNSSNTKDDIGTITESILMYSRKIESIEVNLQEYKRKYKYTDEEGMEYNLEEPLKTNSGEYERKTMKFEIKTPYGNFLPPKGKRWTLGKEKVEEIIKKGKYVVKDNKIYIKKENINYITICY